MAMTTAGNIPRSGVCIGTPTAAASETIATIYVLLNLEDMRLPKSRIKTISTIYINVMRMMTSMKKYQVLRQREFSSNHII